MKYYLDYCLYPFCQNPLQEWKLHVDRSVICLACKCHQLVPGTWWVPAKCPLQEHMKWIQSHALSSPWEVIAIQHKKDPFSVHTATYMELFPVEQI